MISSEIITIPVGVSF